MQKYSIKPILLMLERENSFTAVEVNLKYSVSFDTIVPETHEEAEEYHNAVERASKFLSGLSGAYVLETDYENTDIFVTGRISNITIEVPQTCSKTPLLGLILMKKVQALLGDFKIQEFSMDFSLYKDHSSVTTSIHYTPEELENSRLQNMFQEHEDMWIEDLSEQADEAEVPDDDDMRKPWWNRMDGHVRDFLNVSPDELEDGYQFFVSPVDIGEKTFGALSDMLEELDDDLDDDSSDDSNDIRIDKSEPTPDTDDDGNYKI